MATSTTTTPKTASTNGRPGNKAGSDDLERQVEQLRGDIQSLAQTIGSITSDQITRYQAKAASAKRDVVNSSTEALESLQGQIKVYEQSLTSQVREKPLQAIGIAAGVGFLLAMFTRR
ncbi:YqjD family protein [Tepidamorphus sp. 3E244]|uniref:DUF883 family protein n=1 Tax=Tepidamorphus sp. 3E244 TaxID=3385498 RepID=UPI0038FC8D41